MKKQRKRGFLIALEGIDGSGKSTQARLLIEFLNQRGYKTCSLYEPTHGLYGSKLRQQARTGRVSPEEEFNLFLLDRKDDVENNIIPALNDGKIVVIDRYLYSSMAYQGARGIDPYYILAENEKIAPRADLVLYLKIPIVVSSLRIIKQRNDTPDHFEHHTYQAAVAAIYDDMCRKLPEFRVINAARNIDQVQTDIRHTILKLINTSDNS